MNISIGTALLFIGIFFIFTMGGVIIVAIVHSKNSVAEQGIKTLEKTMSGFTRVMGKAINKNDSD